MSTSQGLLILAATPIGDPRDASARLALELGRADVVAAEDTRRLHRLCSDLEVKPAGVVLAYHEHNEASRTAELVDRVREGARVLLVTDAGMPSVSDPGYRLVQAAVAAELRLTCIPGPSAVPVALALSGLPVDRFCFEGFLPRKAGERTRALSTLAHEPRTMVFFEAPHRLGAAVEAMVQVFGADRQAAVCRELTKTYEEVRRGPLREIAEWASEGVRGEITVVVQGASRGRADPSAVVEEVLQEVAAGVRLKDACKSLAAARGCSSKELYDLAVARQRARRA